MDGGPERDELLARIRHLETESGRLRRLFDHLPALAAYWDADLRNVIANKAYVEWFGTTLRDVHGRHIRDVVGERVYAATLPHIEGVLAGEDQLVNRTLVDSAGRSRHTQAFYVPEIVAGEVVGFFVLVTDVTPVVETREELDAAQRLAHLGSWSYDPYTTEMTWSREMYRILGKDPEYDTSSMENYIQAVHPDDRPAIRGRQAAATQMSEPYDVRYRIVLPDGEVRHVHSRGRPELRPDGTVVRIDGTVQDETELQEAAHRLADANAVLSDTMAMLSHDIRQPIHAVTGYLDLALAEWEELPRERVQEYVGRALQAASRMNALVDDVLKMASIDSGGISTQPTDVCLAATVRNLIAVQGPADVEVAVPHDVEVRADPFHLRQVLANLLENAQRYGERPIQVRIDADRAHGQITVIDHGEGVPEEFVPQLFERFTRAESGVAATKAGTGFGLYIVRQLVLANGGEITYRHAEPTGAAFTVTLPLAGGSATSS